MERATRTSQRMDRDDVARPSPPPEVDLDIAVTEESKWIGRPRERLTLDVDWRR
jgi:hypothetical protein